MDGTDCGAALPYLTGGLRRAQTAASLAGLEERVVEWSGRRKKLDDQHQHHAQIVAIAEMVGAAGGGLARALERVPAQNPLETYAACHLFDLRALWVRRVWDFFRGKLEQRDVDEHRSLLRAADQVVWSCHQPPLEAAERTPVVAPLAFVESRYALEAYPAPHVPGDLSEDVGFLAVHLARLPVGLVRIPPDCVRAPWWLVLVAHEVGHNLQAELHPDLPDAFRTALGEAARAAGNDDDAAYWRRWGDEVFADAVSVLLAGQWAVRAVLELELREAPQMAIRRGRYPPSIVRLELMTRMAARCGLDCPSLEELLTPAVVAEAHAAARDRALLEAVLDAVLAPLPVLDVQLAKLCKPRRELARRGQVDDWATELASDGQLPRAGGPHAARLMACASFAAWTGLPRDVTPAERRAAEVKLADRALVAIEDSKDPATRGDVVPAVAKGSGDDIAAALLAADEDTLLERRAA